MKLIVGLGNPGKKYQSTKHNIGFMALDSYCKENKLKFKKEKRFLGEYVKVKNTIFLKPHTFMNNSGQSIASVIDFYNIELEDILIIYDDLDLPTGKIRLREKGGAGGHNGIKSVINHLKTQEFRRVRVGIDSNPLIETKDYVLGKFNKNEKKTIKDTLPIIHNIIDDFHKGTDFIKIMNNYN